MLIATRDIQHSWDLGHRYFSVVNSDSTALIYLFLLYFSPTCSESYTSEVLTFYGPCVCFVHQKLSKSGSYLTQPGGTYLRQEQYNRKCYFQSTFKYIVITYSQNFIPLQKGWGFFATENLRKKLNLMPPLNTLLSLLHLTQLLTPSVDKITFQQSSWLWRYDLV